MKYPIAILVLLLISSIYGQELVVDTLTNAYNTGTTFKKTYQYPQWNNELDFAIYGWFKLSSAYVRNEWATAVHFTSNGNNWSNASLNGDRKITFFTINNWLHNPTYSIARGNTNYYDNVVYNTGDLDQWAFFYVAHGSQQQAQFIYYKLAQSGELTKKLTQVTHQPSSFYQINVGQSFSFKYFPGALWRVTIQGGAGAYRESGFDTLYSVNPTQSPSCVTVYTGCAFSGTATSVCQNIPNFNVSTIKSIYVPSGYTLTVYDTANFAGKKVTYNQSIECITSFNWAMLVNTGAITVEDVKPALRKSSKKHH